MFLYNQFYYTCVNLPIIFLFDTVLIKLLLDKARWYQLHFIINSITVFNIFSSVKKILLEPEIGYEVIENDNLSQYISNLHICVHIYHIQFFKNLNYWDYFHHIIFVFFGVIPGLIFVNSNQLLLEQFTCGGLPGMIEYGSLVLYKHEILNKYQQKKINTILYIFLRLPMCIMGIFYSILAYKNNYIKDPLWITIYVNFLLYLNGTLFTRLTAQSFFNLKNIDE